MCPSRSSYDVIVFGATPAGLAAALAAERENSTVLLLEPSKYVGGMASPGGIGLRDCEDNEIRMNNGSQYQWAMRNAKKYGVTDPVWQVLQLFSVTHANFHRYLS
jgi:pyruvate/2-oxoglutarate dehydrogenase complex dihydrolipoamide dehydrogenase (E3) component